MKIFILIFRLNKCLFRQNYEIFPYRTSFSYKNRTFAHIKQQAGLSLALECGRKVRATQSILLPNRKLSARAE